MICLKRTDLKRVVSFTFVSAFTFCQRKKLPKRSFSLSCLILKFPVAIMTPWPLLFHVLLNNLYLVSRNINIDCTTVEGDNSGSGDGDLSTVTCTTNYPTMVSCGFRTKDSTDKDFEGSWMDTSGSTHECVARNANSGAGVYAYARCWYTYMIIPSILLFVSTVFSTLSIH